MQAGEKKKMLQGNLVGNIAILVAMTIALIAPADAQTWQSLGKSATIPVVVENTACNPSTDTVGITADHTTLLTCQSGQWKSSGTGMTYNQIKALRAKTSLSCSLSSTSIYGNNPSTPHWYSVSGDISYNTSGSPYIRVSATGGYWNQTCPSSCDTGAVAGTTSSCSVANRCDSRTITFTVTNTIYGEVTIATSGADVDTQVSSCTHTPSYSPLFR